MGAGSTDVTLVFLANGSSSPATLLFDLLVGCIVASSVGWSGSLAVLLVTLLFFGLGSGTSSFFLVLLALLLAGSLLGEDFGSGAVSSTVVIATKSPLLVLDLGGDGTTAGGSFLNLLLFLDGWVGFFLSPFGLVLCSGLQAVLPTSGFEEASKIKTSSKFCTMCGTAFKMGFAAGRPGDDFLAVAAIGEKNLTDVPLIRRGLENSVGSNPFSGGFGVANSSEMPSR